jgi:hypothetical protein
MNSTNHGGLPTRGTPFRMAHARRGILAAVAILAVPLAMAGGSLALASPPAHATAYLSESQYLDAVADFTDARLQATGTIAVARSVVASAQLSLDRSSGKVRSEASRAALLYAIGRETLRIAAAEEELESAALAVDGVTPASSFFSGRPAFVEAAATLRRLTFPTASGLTSVRGNLAGPVKAVTDAVTAWHADQARVAAVTAARAAAAKAAAAQAARAAAAKNAGVYTAPVSGSGRAGVAPAPSNTVRFNKYVWTSGWQAQIDACRGAVDITGHYGVAVIAEHWSCGGSSFPRAGTVITLSGVRSGTYRVGGVVAVLNANTQGTSNIPRGYGLLYQTCINGSNATMSFTVLTRIG